MNTNYGKEEIIEPTSFNLTNTHPRDQRLKFYPEQHVYTFDDAPATPVSTVIASWFPTFDAETNAGRKGTPSHPKEQYLEEWGSNGIRARAIGTYMHDQIERTLLQKPTGDTCHFAYHGQYVNVDEDINIRHELSLFHNFMNEWSPIPYRTEWRICDEEHHVAGTIDFLTRNAEGQYIMFDWKRSNKIGVETCDGFQVVSRCDYHRHAYGLLSHLDDTPYHHYCLQQNLYRYMLRRHYGIELTAMYLVVLHPDNATFHCVEVPPMEPEVNIILNRLTTLG